MNNNKWQFDKKYFNDLIWSTQEKLKNTNLSKQTQFSLQETLYETISLLRLLNGNNYCFNNEQYYAELSNNTKYSLLLDKMQKDYYKIERGLLDLIVFLMESKVIVEYQDNKYEKEIKPGDIVAKSVEVYDKFLPLFLPVVQTIIDFPIDLINFDKTNNVGSQCFFIDDLPFLHIENYTKQPENFIHELQHGVEKICGYKPQFYYRELGSILLETLYIDTLVRDKVPLSSNLYFARINEAEAFIEYLGRYFKCIKELGQYSFSVNNIRLLNIIEKNNIMFNGQITVEEILNDNFKQYLMYVLSFFKSIEIRNMMYQDKKKALELLLSTLKGESVIHDKSCVLRDYEGYISDTLELSKQYRKKLF